MMKTMRNVESSEKKETKWTYFKFCCQTIISKVGNKDKGDAIRVISGTFLTERLHYKLKVWDERGECL